MEKSVNNEKKGLHLLENERIDIQKLRRLLIEFFTQKSPPKNDGHGDGRKPVDLDDTLAALFTDYPYLQNDLTHLLPDYRAEASLQNPEPANDSVADNARQDGVRDEDFETHRPDIKDCERCTPSYCRLPDDYQIPLASNREEDDIAVLNDLLVAVTSGIMDCPFEYTRKNEYEHSLFRCEDHRFELDMMLEIANAAIRRVQTLLKAIEQGDNRIRLEDRLTAGDIRCIERLYGGGYLESLMGYVREMPSVVLPGLLTHLKERKKEWEECRTDFNATCAEEYAKYHRRSLDYRGYEFKKWDMESLSTKALLAEIEKNSGIESKNEHMLPCLSDGKEQHILISQLELGYSDPDIHDDILLLIKYSVGRRYGPELLDKVMKIWKHFLEGMLRPEDTDDAHGEAEESVHTLSNEGIESARRISPDEKGSHDGPDEDVTKASERDSDSRLFYGNESFYVLFMLHNILYERLQLARLCSCSAANTWRICNDKDSADCYARFLSALFTLLEGSFEQEKFEDECLTILGPDSYILFTLDKLIHRIVEQLHCIANSEINCKLIELYECESARKPWTSVDDKNYIERVRRLVPDINLFRNLLPNTNQYRCLVLYTNLFRLEYTPAAGRLSIQLMKFCSFGKADEGGNDGGRDDDCSS